MSSSGKGDGRVVLSREPAPINSQFSDLSSPLSDPPPFVRRRLSSRSSSSSSVDSRMLGNDLSFTMSDRMTAGASSSSFASDRTHNDSSSAAAAAFGEGPPLLNGSAPPAFSSGANISSGLPAGSSGSRRDHSGFKSCLSVSTMSPPRTAVEIPNLPLLFKEAPQLVKAFVADLKGVKLINWEIRLPFFGDAAREEAVTALNHVYAGTCARTLSQFLCHPVDTVKTRMQIKDPPKKLRKWRKKIVKKAIGIGPVDIDNWFFKGPGDLYRGVWGAILGTIPNAALYFVAYESVKRRLEKKKLNPGLVHLTSASVGTIAASIVRVPADTLKHRVQAYMHTNVFEAFVAVVSTNGIGGLYRGFLPTLMRDVPEIVIQFGVYERARMFLQRQRKVEKLSTPEHLLLGAFAGAVAATCTMPLDLVKTRQQCGAGALAIHQIIRQVYAESGVVGLTAGLGPRVFHVSLMSAAFFGLFEFCKMQIKPDRTSLDKLFLPKIWNKPRDKIWKRQFVYTG
eukprot:TRINITY_DN7080_c0_g1_i1.p1 TRINITY_DN7080_c0_g1~~TRINITY_DN7080_c0_g1_i1.p1  ORF type:complete len:510 (-),score=74.59 TRINITY_DN7080_c0_g1_i1:901-2430(-)